jgi:hypothetical protein
MHKAVLEIPRAVRFADQEPGEICDACPDIGDYLCSARTMCRILEMHDEVID